MTKEIHRGHPFPSGMIHKESQELGSYQSWDEWKRVIEHRLGFDFKEIENGAEPILKETYELRRMIQLNRRKLDDWLNFIAKTDQKHPGFLDKYGEAVKFIVDRTESNEIRGKAKKSKTRH